MVRRWLTRPRSCKRTRASSCRPSVARRPSTASRRRGRNSRALLVAAPQWRHDVHFALDAVGRNASALGLLPTEFQEDPEFLKQALARNGDTLRYVPEPLGRGQVRRFELGTSSSQGIRRVLRVVLHGFH